jgi:hypothetical protein
MIALNLPEYKHRFNKSDKGLQLYDRIRKKFVALTPEEWVRQNFICYLLEEKQFPLSLMAVETGLKFNTLQKRSDIVLYNTLGKPHVVVECKAPEIKLTQDAFDQVARYNWVIKADYLIVTNGLNHFCCRMDYENNNYAFLKEIPFYKEIS